MMNSILFAIEDSVRANYQAIISDVKKRATLKPEDVNLKYFLNFFAESESKND